MMWLVAFKRSYRVELRKLFRRKDTWLLLSILLVPALYSIGSATNSSVITYAGHGNVDALQYADQILFSAHSMFIFYVMAAIVTSRSFASEIEDKSIILYIPRIHNRRALYMAKLAALFSITLAVLLLCVVATGSFYYLFLVRRPDIANGQMWKSSAFLNSIFSIISVFFLFLFTESAVAVLAMYFKSITSIIIFMILLVALNLVAAVPAAQLLSPWYYVSNISSGATGSASVMTANVLYTTTILTMLAAVGSHLFKKKDL